MRHTLDIEYLVIGGGFYGTCLALFLRSVCERVTLIEARGELLSRASRVNQARVHTGFHYPRSVLTAAKSLALHTKFIHDFPDAIMDEFQMIYAIARRHSKVSARRFDRMFAELGAPIEPATPSQAALFHPDTIEAAFACREYAFDYSVLRARLIELLDSAGIELHLESRVEHIAEDENGVLVSLEDGRELSAETVFNVTYAGVNQFLSAEEDALVPLKHELTEIVLVDPPEELKALGVTVMDGPFFSIMPYPSEGCHSLTHVRYTPYFNWREQVDTPEPTKLLNQYPHSSNFMHMIKDARRFLPSVADCQFRTSLREVKTILLKSENDDGRPILYRRRPANSRIISVLGGKIDNIYDLFDVLKADDSRFAGADGRFLFGAW